MSKTVYTVGHSNRPFEEFLELIRAYGVKVVVDVRSRPKSRWATWSARGTLAWLLEQEGIGYVWLGELLGGFRMGGFKEYMKTDGYRRGVEMLVGVVEYSPGPVALMCREKLWFKCHRRHIAGSLASLGYRVVHIVDGRRYHAHKVLRL